MDKPLTVNIHPSLVLTEQQNFIISFSLLERSKPSLAQLFFPQQKCSGCCYYWL